MSDAPIIHNGDHAEFEREHVNTPPEQRPDWPLPSFKATDWAAHFCKLNLHKGVDEETMIGWFANSLMRGFDEGYARARKHAKKEFARMRWLLAILGFTCLVNTIAYLIILNWRH